MQLAGRTFGLVEFSRAPGDPPYEGEALEAARQIALTVSLVLETTRLDDEVEHARRDRERFLSLAAHELKTPITTLSGYAQLTARQMNRPEGIDPERAQRALEAMDRAATRLFRLVVQMLDSANLLNETLVLQVSRVDLVQLVQDVVKAVQAQDTSHPIRLDAPPNLEAVADPARVEQVVLSLLDNAVKYSPEGSEVEVEMGASPTEQVHLVVRDRGIGIAERHRENVFEPFFKEQPTRHVAGTVGMGLGLHATRGIVEKHGGSISLRSRPGGGTEVEVRIPREAETDTQE